MFIYYNPYLYIYYIYIYIILYYIYIYIFIKCRSHYKRNVAERSRHEKRGLTDKIFKTGCEWPVKNSQAIHSVCFFYVFFSICLPVYLEFSTCSIFFSTCSMIHSRFTGNENKYSKQCNAFWYILFKIIFII